MAWPALDNDCNKDSMIVMDFATACQKKIEKKRMPPLSSSRSDRASLVRGGGFDGSLARPAACVPWRHHWTAGGRIRFFFIVFPGFLFL